MTETDLVRRIHDLELGLASERRARREAEARAREALELLGRIATELDGVRERLARRATGPTAQPDGSISPHAPPTASDLGRFDRGTFERLLRKGQRIVPTSSFSRATPVDPVENLVSTLLEGGGNLAELVRRSGGRLGEQLLLDTLHHFHERGLVEFD